MGEEKISIEIAKLIKKIDFNWGCHEVFIVFKGNYIHENNQNHPQSYYDGEVKEEHSFYHKNNIEGFDLSNRVYDIYARPTLAVLQKWFMQEHSIFVLASFTEDGVSNDWIASVHGVFAERGKFELGKSDGKASSYEEALMIGLYIASEYLYNEMMRMDKLKNNFFNPFKFIPLLF